MVGDVADIMATVVTEDMVSVTNTMASGEAHGMVSVTGTIAIVVTEAMTRNEAYIMASVVRCCGRRYVKDRGRHHDKCSDRHMPEAMVDIMVSVMTDAARGRCYGKGCEKML